MKKQHWILLTTLFVITWVILIWRTNRVPQTGYVDLKVVFDEFAYTQELKKDLFKVQNARQKLIDSMEFELKVLSKEVESGKSGEVKRKFDVKLENLMKFRKQMEEDNLALTEQLDGKILTQMNQYVKDFGKEKGFDVIIGSQGDGTVMHASEDLNVTKEVVAYINNKYKGKQ